MRYLNAVGGGEVVRVENNIAIVDDDGFETPVPVRECVVVGQATAHNAKEKKPETFAPARQPQTPDTAASAAAPRAAAPAPMPQVADEEPEEEVEGGDILNIVLAFTPTDLKSISNSQYEAFIVNDSNYYLSIAVLTRADDSDEWTTQYAGPIEPNMQVLIGTFTPQQTAAFDHLAVQYIAYKQNKPFALKEPHCVQHNVDTTKFYKLHCFRNNIYFDEPVLAFDIVRDDKPADRRVNVDAGKLQREMQRKKEADRRPVRRRVHKSADNGTDPLVVDLHITELIDNTRGLSNADMLNLQVDKFREVMDANLRNIGRRLIFIHGKGEGVLRQALTKELNHRYRGHDVQDASFREYGYGATQVTIRNIRKE